MRGWAGALCSPPHPPPRARSLSLSSPPQWGAQDRARAAQAPPPGPGASGHGEPPFLGKAWPEPCAAPLPSCYLRRVSLALEVSPLGFYPGEVEGGGGVTGVLACSGVEVSAVRNSAEHELTIRSPPPPPLLPPPLRTPFKITSWGGLTKSKSLLRSARSRRLRGSPRLVKRMLRHFGAF